MFDSFIINIGFNEKNITKNTLGRPYLFSIFHLCGAVIADFDDIINLEIKLFFLHFSEVLKFN